MPSIYSVTLNAPSGTISAPHDGFLDPQTIERYMAAASTPSTYAQSQAKKRGNIRWMWLTAQLGSLGSPQIAGITATGASATADATSITLTVSFDDDISTFDEQNPGTFLAGADALARACARAMVTSENLHASIYDPTVTTRTFAGRGGGASRTVNQITGVRVDPITVGSSYPDLATATGAITITTS